MVPGLYRLFCAKIYEKQAGRRPLEMFYTYPELLSMPSPIL